MSYHPSGITIEIVGTEASGNGRTCDAHDVCGNILSDDVVVRLRKVQILSDRGVEETAIAAYLVSDGIDQCRVGFLQRHLVPHAKNYDGVLAQITEVYGSDSESPSKRKRYHHNRGCCLAAIISYIPPTPTGSATSSAPNLDLAPAAKRSSNYNAQDEAQKRSSMAGETSEDEDVSMASLSTTTGNSSNAQRKKKATDAGDTKTVPAPATKKTKNVLPTVITTPQVLHPKTRSWFSDNSRDEDYVPGEESSCS
ncbi:hypothetical protein MHU86_4486 [Fragilaria crotonensis]|nr:hypothetical protein MHU86_4486 [Fragilaria crotonensis]